MVGGSSLFAFVESEEEFHSFVFTEDQPFVVSPGGHVSVSGATSAGLEVILAAELAAYANNPASEPVPAEDLLRAIPVDPLFANQWHLLNTGQIVGQPDYQFLRGVPGVDLNVVPVWEAGYTGAGVTVGIVDSGVETLHPDLIDNIGPTEIHFDALDGGNNPNPFFLNPGNAHGTAVAGIVAASANDIGGVGIAPGAEIAGIRLVDNGISPASIADMFRHATDVIDIYNHSWGPPDIRSAASFINPDAAVIQAMRDSVYFGRDGLGVLHFWAAGNGGEGLDYSSYDAYVNSRWTIGVTGHDHDGEYANIDGTRTSYPEGGPSVFVTAPTGSVALDVGLESGTGSGIVTTDLSEEFGYNQGPDPDTLEEVDRDFLADEDYTSLFNGTSASTPMGAGVAALILEANPNLSYRDVQEILVRSAAPIAYYEIPETGGGLTGYNSWITNHDQFFQDPDPWDMGATPNFLLQLFPIADAARPIEPFLWTNGAGYTVSQGRGAFNEAVGYGHGAIDAELAVAMAEQWHTLEQNLAPELTFTTFVLGGPGAVGGENGDASGLVIPGAIGGSGGFADYWDEYYEDEPEFFPPINTRGAPSVTYEVPDNNAMSIEWVEIRGDFTGSWDTARLTLVSPNGVYSDFTHYFDPNPPNLARFPEEWSVIGGDPAGEALAGAGRWTFSTNRNWGERSDAAVMFDPVTGDPYMLDALGAPTTDPAMAVELLERGWELRIENYGPGPVSTGTLEVIWHGTPIDAESQRIQGFVGIDDNADGLFNFERYQQEVVEADMDPTVMRHGEVVRTVDENQEDFAEGVVVSVRRASDNFVVDQFLTGHDGNYYFDLVPDTYIVSVEAPEGFTAMDDPNTPADFMSKYLAEWVITPDYFNVWDRDRPDIALDPDWDPTVDYDVPIDATTGAPVNLQIMDADEDSPTFGQLISVPYHASGINFLLDPPEVPPQQVEFNGTLYSDNNGDGLLDEDDTVQSGIRMYVDVNFNNFYDPADVWTVTDANGDYTLVVEAESTLLYQVGVDAPFGWTPTSPESGFSDQILVQVGEVVTDIDFLVAPPGVDPGDPGGGGGGPGGGEDDPGTIGGTVYLDADADGFRDASDAGIAGYTVYLDTNFNGVLDGDERSTTTNGAGQYLFDEVEVRTYVVRLDETDGFAQTSPAGGSGIVVNMHAGDIVTGQLFGVRTTTGPQSGTISGAVFLDENGDGVRQIDEDGIPGFQVYVDVNGDDVFNLADGDIPASMNISGGFSFNNAPVGLHTLRLAPLANFNQTAPVGDEFIVNLLAGTTISNLQFGVESDVQPGEFGNIEGTVYLDENGNSLLDDSESGVVGFNVYIDANNDGAFVPADGDLQATAGANGAFSFTNVPAGIHVLRVEGVAGYLQTDPITGGGRVVNLEPGEVEAGLLFGMMAEGDSEFDYGDLPDAPTLLIDSGPRHLVVAGHSLGLLVDTEGDGLPNSTATGDDIVSDDEDGVTLLGDGTLMPGEDAIFSVVVNGIGMYLNSWMDLNGDGTFNNDDEWIVRDADVNPGVHEFTYAVPDDLNIVSGPVAMRWRLGTETSTGHDYRGDDIIGEVEDYLVPINPAAQNVIDDPIPGDYDANGFVDQADHGVWRSAFGTSSADADGNGDGRVDIADYNVWRDNLGAGSPPAGSLLLGGGLVTEGTGGDDAGTATRSGYAPFASGDPLQWVESAANGGQDGSFVGPLAIGDGSSISLFGSTFGTAPVSSAAPVGSLTPALAISPLDLYFDQVADDNSVTSDLEFQQFDSSDVEATDYAFASGFDEDFWS